jgi:2-amino-4-hydroxy-6-hydroxymethyldihydropteridine diphosphokinase
MNRAFLSIGSNLGNREEMLKFSQTKLAELGTIVKLSSIYETAPVGDVAQSDFLNQICELNTSLEPEKLMSQLLEIESSMGRVRDKKWGPRKIDLDIISFNDLRMDNLMLKLPHPEFHKRRFVLIPLNEIAADFKINGKTVHQHLRDCRDQQNVTLFLGK